MGLFGRHAPDSAHFAVSYSSFGQAEHVGALGVFGAAAAFLRREDAVGVDLALEAFQELLAGGSGAGGAVVGAAPGDLGGYALVDVLRRYVQHLLPLEVRLRSVVVCVFIYVSSVHL